MAAFEVLIDPNPHTHLWPKVGQWQANGQAEVLLQSEERVAPKPYAAYPGQDCTGEGLVKS